MSGKKQTIRKCLETLGVAADLLAYCDTIQEEFTKIKKEYFRKALSSHPDKGGDADVFRGVQTSFEVLRELYDSARVDSFVTSGQKSTADSYSELYEDFGEMHTPSWEFYYSAAEEAVPTYRMELAKSGRSACKQRGAAKKCSGGGTENPSYIAKGEIRIGSMEYESGSYSRWVHLRCWRVPSKVWLGMPDCNPDPSVCTCSDRARFEAALLSMNEVLLCGFSELSKSDRSVVVSYVMDKRNWARLVNRKPPAADADGVKSESTTDQESKGNNGSTAMAPGSSERAMVSQGGPARERFVVPVPGKGGTMANSLAGKTVVCTGIFPELGGGAGLNLGKDKLKSMVSSFGGRVTGSVSGKTDILVVGKDPGYSKVSAARQKGIPLMSLKDLATGLTSAEFSLEDVKPMQISTFSSGYGGNSLSLTARKEDVAIAQGRAPAGVKIKAASKKKDPVVKKEKAVSRKRAIAAVEEESESDVEITCDGCGNECTKLSWFVESTKSDYCESCRPATGAVLQANGVTVAALENKAKSSKEVLKKIKIEKQ